MTDVFFLIIVIITIGLFGGLIYIIYLPFKKRLIKSGKISRQINWAFFLLLFLIGVVLYNFKEYRTPSKERLEEISNINLPTNFIVLKDEYQDMWQDYCILYDIQLEGNSKTELIKNIRNSKYYNPNLIHKGAWQEKDFITVDSVKAVWSKLPEGYNFSGQDGLTSYSIALDTVTNILKYNECAD